MVRNHSTSNFKKVCRIIDKTYAKLKSKKMGELPSYIPGLAHGDPNNFAITFTTVNGRQHSIGSSGKKVTIQSVSKLLVLAQAIEECGVTVVDRHVGLEGNPFPFNSLTGAILTPSKTVSPFTNQGAMATTGLLYGTGGPEFEKRVLSKICEFTGSSCHIDESVAASDLHENIKNRALAWIMASYGKLNSPVDEVLNVYTKQCAVEVDSNDLSVAGATLANGGLNPITGKQVVSKMSAVYTIRYLNSVTLPNADLKWDVRVGSVPVKSGVGGGMLIVVNGVGGLGIVSPPLTKEGISAKGYAAAAPITRSILKTYVPTRHPGYAKTSRRSRRKRGKRKARRKSTLRRMK